MYQIKFEITTLADGSYSSALLPLTAPQANVSDFGKGPMLLYAVEWVDTDFDAGVDAVLSITSTLGTNDKTLLTLTNADAEVWYYPRVLECDNAGTATTFYAMQIVEGTLKLTVTAGGNVKTGKCIVYLLEA